MHFDFSRNGHVGVDPASNGGLRIPDSDGIVTPVPTPEPQCPEKYALTRAIAAWCAVGAMSNLLAMVASDGFLVCEAGNGAYAPQRYTYVRASEYSLAFSFY